MIKTASLTRGGFCRSSFIDKTARQKGPDGPFFIWVGEKVGQTETKSVKELEGNVLFGEESLKTGGKDFLGWLLS